MATESKGRQATKRQYERDTAGYPSHQAPTEVKQKKKWCLDYTMTFHNENERGEGSALYKQSNQKYQEWRDLMRGNQDIDQYKPQLGVKKGRNNRSWKAIDWSILPIAPKFKELLIGKLINTPFNIRVEGIDKQSEEEKKDFENRLKENVINKDMIQGIEQNTGIEFEDTLAKQGVPEPDSLEEAETVSKMFYKDEYAMELKDALDLCFDVSDFKQVRREVVEDLVEVGIGGTKEWIDNNGFPKFRRIVPERTVTNNVQHNDYRDLIRIGEYVEMTIADLKSMAGDAFTEDEYREIANQASRKSYGYTYTKDYEYDYSYDRERITVFDCCWYSVDNMVHVEKPNSFGNKRLKKKASDFLKDVEEKEYKQRYPGREIFRNDIRNVYQCKWVVDTDHAWDYGLATNMIREASDLRETTLPFTVYSTGFDSIARLIEPVIHNCQLNWLQYQNHIARSRPSGLAIEMSALENITLGTTKKRLPPKEVLRMYMDTGTLLWRRKNWNNASNQWKPIEELQNGISPAAAQHFQNIVGNVDLLRNILGISEVEDASTPNPNILKGVAELASVGTNNALQFLFHGERSVLTRMSKKLAIMIPDGRKISSHKGFSDALGTKSEEFWKTLEGREFGVIIDDGPTMEERQRFQVYVQASLEAGYIMPDEAFEIDREKNIIRAAQVLRNKRKLREKEQQAAQQQGYEAEQQKNIASSQAATQADAEKMQMEYELKGRNSQLEGQIEIMVNKEKTMNEILLEKVRNGSELSQEENSRVTDLMKIDNEYEWKLVLQERQNSAMAKISKQQKF